MTIKAIAVAEDYQQSEISTFSYGFASQVSAPVANFASGELDMGTEMHLPVRQKELLSTTVQTEQNRI